MDLELSTVDDYTAQTLLNPSIYRAFIADRGSDHDRTIAPIMGFKQAMISAIRSQLGRAGGLSEENSEIVDIHFGFFNRKLTDKLEERADALKAADFKKLQENQR